MKPVSILTFYFKALNKMLFFMILKYQINM